MHIIRKASKLTSLLSTLRQDNQNVTIGFVPTMGALHQGHISLIEASVKANPFTVCSVFVNPTQFGDKGDLDNYPKPIEKDIDMLIAANCSILFLPDVKEVYPEPYTDIVFDIGDLETKIEGEKRPGHFQGVCNVLNQFFTLIRPDNAYFGQKDFQQTAVVKKLVQLTGAKTAIQIVPIKREEHGLAMSSRNVRLSAKGRQNAAFIYKSLLQLKEDVKTMSLSKAKEKAIQFINANKGAEVDYLEIVETTNLNNISSLNSTAVCLTVVKYEGVRLLDNILL